MNAIKLPLPLVFGALSLCGCEYFTEITLEDGDVTPPAAAARLVEVGGVWLDETSFGALDPVSLVTGDPNRALHAIAAAWDPEGAFRVSMEHEVYTACQTGDLVAIAHSDLGTEAAEQDAEVGDTIDDGLWVGHYVKMSDWDDCPAGSTLLHAEYRWSVEAENYAGDVENHGPSVIRYEP